MRKAVKRVKSNFWNLYKAQLSMMLWAGKKNPKNKKRVKARSASGTVVAWVIAGIIIALYEYIFMSMLYVEGNTAVFPPLVAMFAMFLTLLTSVSYAKALLFEAKDHDMLFSLPIPGRTIVAAKLLTMYTLDSILNIVMLVPCAIFYGILERPHISFYIYYFILMLFVSLIPILVASIISALMSIIASRFRHAQFVTVILYVIFLCAIMGFSMTMGYGTGSDEDIAVVGVMFESLLNGMSTIYPPLAWFKEAAMEGSLSSALLFVGVSLLAFAVVALVFGKFYGKIHEMFRPRAIRRKYKSSEKSSGITLALMKKDMKRLFSSATIFMNQLVGLLMLVVFAVMFSIQNFSSEGEEVAEAFSVMFPFIFAMAAAMVSDTSTSISLEGKTFPLLKSLPISPKEILRSKLYLHMAFCAPVILICGIAVSIVNGLPVVGAIATVVVPLCYAYSSGIVGLLINLKKYKFDWTSEVTIAKNNLPLVITMLGGMVLSIAPMAIALVLYFAGLPLAAILGGCIALSAIFAVVMTLLMNAFGEKWFLKIEY